MSTPKITFVLTAHEELYSHHVSLGSLMCQTSPNWRCLIMSTKPILKYRSFFDDRILEIRHKPSGYWGHFDRIKSLHLVDTEYIIQSSIQDFFFPNMVALIEDQINLHNPDMILWNSMNHLYHDNSIFYAEPERLKIDWGNMCVRTQLATEVDINHPTRDICDGLFAEEVAAKAKGIVKIEKVLTIHI